MKNWLGQDIEVGSVVGRGARQGNSSDFKLGIVTKLDEPSLKARVNWLYDYNVIRESQVVGTWHDGRPRTEWVFWAYVPHRIDSNGSPGIESLWLLKAADLEWCDQAHDLVVERNERKAGIAMTKEEFLERLEAI